MLIYRIERVRELTHVLFCFVLLFRVWFTSHHLPPRTVRLTMQTTHDSVGCSAAFFAMQVVYRVIYTQVRNCQFCHFDISNLKATAITCSSGACQNKRNAKKKATFLTNSAKRPKLSAEIASAQILTEIVSEVEEQKNSIEIEQTTTGTMKIQSLSSVETSTTIRQVNGGAAETVTETKIVSSSCFVLFS